jgi:hypothetical protein
MEDDGQDNQGDSNHCAHEEEETDDAERKDDAGKKKRGRRPKKPEPKFPVEPRVIQIVNKPKSFMNHSYRDFSQVPPEEGYKAPAKIENMSFAEKVHRILSTPEYKDWIGWLPHGRAFKVLVPKQLESNKILLNYFNHNRYSSFLRQLNNFGFKHLTAGVDRNAYYHEFMLRGLPHLCRYMPEARDARRLIPDPENEPDFYSISRVFPLPDDEPERIGATVSGDATVLPTSTKRLASDSFAQGPAKIQAVTSSMGVPMRSPVVDVAQVRDVLLGNDAAVKALAAGLHTELFAMQQPQQEASVQQVNPAFNALAAYLRAAGQGGSSLGL